MVKSSIKRLDKKLIILKQGKKIHYKTSKTAN
jgi:hypothetical protein